MLKPVKFPQATAFMPAQSTDADGKVMDFAYHFYSDPKGKFSVSCVELSDEEIKAITASRKLWIVMPFPTMPPFTLEHVSPFTPKILGRNGKSFKDENKD